MPPFGIGYLASIARNRGFEVDIFDARKGDKTYESFIEKIKNNNYDLVGASMTTFDFNPVKEHIKYIKKYSPNSIIVLGGAHPSGDYSGILNDFPQAGFAFRGEAELGFAKFLDHLAVNKLNTNGLELIPNLIWRKDNQIQINPWQVVENLDTLPFPAWDLIDPRTYPKSPHGAFAANFPVAPMVISRGCPYNCTFCSGKSVTGLKLRRRSIDNAISEIEFLQKNYDVREIHIEDENFTFFKDAVKEFCLKIINHPWLKISWSLPSGIRLDTLDDEILELMQRSGCYSAAVGVEFGTEKMHRLTNKRLNLNLIREKIKLLKKYKIKITGFFLIGIPGETLEDMNKTIKLSLELDLDRAQFNNFMPLPGSPLYDQLKKDKNFSFDTDHFFVHDVAYAPAGISKKKLKSIQRNAYLKFYLRPKIIVKLIKEIKDLDHFKKLVYRFFDSIRG